MNKSISKIDLGILDKSRQDLLQKLLPFTKEFILGGGTALALQLTHRLSFDFDFFALSPIPQKLLEKISQAVAVANIAVDTPDELTFFTTENIKVTFLSYPFKPHFNPIEAENGLFIFPIQEIALQKAYTIGRRGEYRDYFDLYTILKAGYIKLEEIIDKAKNVYGGAFDEKMFLQQLVYFGDMTNFDITPASEKPLPRTEEVKQYLEKLVKNYLSKNNLQ